jgi:transposase
MAHRTGESRHQTALFPVMLDDLVAEHALVRVVDAWVGHLDVGQLGFQQAQAKLRGAPPYHPADLLRLYIWGYLSSVRSSRALELECHRNVECLWLLGRQAPDHKTIAEFRRRNTQPLLAVCAAFVQFARSQKLIAGTTVAIDGTKLRAVASYKSVTGKRDLSAQAQRNAEEIARYMKLLDAQDGVDSERACKPHDVQQALAQLRAKGEAIQQELQQLQAAGRSSKVETEPEARAMRSLHGAPGYNLQTAVETQSHLIVHHELTTDANDQRQLQPMAEAASRALESPCVAVADAGYANGEQIAALDDQGITSFVAVNRAVNTHGLLDKTAFSYDRNADRYTCPAGKLLQRQKVSKHTKTVVYAAKATDCGGCPMKPACTAAKQRQVTRHLYEDALEANARRMQEQPQMMALRRQTVEHPFGTLKQQILRNARFVMRGLQGAAAESALAVLAYNFKRVFNMKGGAWMHRALQG